MVTAAAPNCGSDWFQGKDEKEIFQFYFRQHWIRLLGPFSRMILWSAAIIAVGFFMIGTLKVTDDFLRHGMLLALCFLFALIQLSFLMRFYVHFLYVIIITDCKIHRIKKNLFSIDDHQAIDIWTLQDIHRCQHGIIQNIFSYGSLILESQETTLKIHFVPQIARKHEQILHLRETARAQMGNVR